MRILRIMWEIMALILSILKKYTPVNEEKIIWYNLELAIHELENKSWNNTIVFNFHSIVSTFQELYVTHEINWINWEPQVSMKWEDYVNNAKLRNHEKNKQTYDDMSSLDSKEILQYSQK